MSNHKYWIILLVFIVLLLPLSQAQTILAPKCQTDSDCPLTVKNDCEGYFIGCSNNYCLYDNQIENGVVCENELVTILLEQQKIEVPKITDIGSKSFVFTANYRNDHFDFGNKAFDTELDFLCNVEDGSALHFPQPNEDCYKTEVSFDGKNYILKNNDEVYLNDHIKFRYNNEGAVQGKTGYVDKDNLAGKFLFTIIDPIEATMNENMEVLHNSNKAFTIDIKNNLPKGNFYVAVSQVAKATNEILPKQEIYKEIGELGTIDIISENANYGIHEAQARIFYKLIVDFKEVLIPLEQVTFNYNVVDNINENNPIDIIEEDIPQNNVYINLDEIPIEVKVTAGIIGVLIILWFFKII